MAERERAVLFIVDDDPQILRALQRVFQQENYRVRLFATVLAARRAIARSRPDLVISDNSMPKVEGLAFLQEIRKSHAATRTVLLTAGLIDDRIAAAVSSGEIDALVQKPWHVDDLIEQIGKLVEKPTSEG